MCAIDRRPVHAACMCMHTASMCSHPHQCVHDWQRGFPNATVGTTKVLTNHGLSQPNCLLVAATRPARSHALCRGCWAGACQSRVHWLPRPKGPRGFHAFAATPTGAGGLRRWAAARGGAALCDPNLQRMLDCSKNARRERQHPVIASMPAVLQRPWLDAKQIRLSYTPRHTVVNR